MLAVRPQHTWIKGSPGRPGGANEWKTPGRSWRSIGMGPPRQRRVFAVISLLLLLATLQLLGRDDDVCGSALVLKVHAHDTAAAAAQGASGDAAAATSGEKKKKKKKKKAAAATEDASASGSAAANAAAAQPPRVDVVVVAEEPPPPPQQQQADETKPAEPEPAAPVDVEIVVTTEAHDDHNHHHHHHDHDHDHHHDHHDHAHDDHHHDHAHSESCGHDHAHAHDHAHTDNAKQPPTPTRSTNDVWTEALTATLVISVLGNAGIVLFVAADVSPSTLKTMVAFAVGGLLGDVFLHLLPHALELAPPHAHGGHSHAPLWKQDFTWGMWVLSGIMVFFLAEKVVLRRLGSSSDGGHSHSHSHSDASKTTIMDDDDHENDDDTPVPSKKKSKTPTPRKKSSKSSSPAPTPTPTKTKSKSKPTPPLSTSTSSSSPWKPGAVLNLAADVSHNFIDGVALAAAFQSSYALGFATTAAVVMHEIPHEMGDFAVLVSQGFSHRAAFLAQFVSALGAFAGCVFGLVVTSEQPFAGLCFTAGAFLYVALADILPELLGESGSKASLGQTLMEAVAMASGVCLMALIEDADHVH